MNTQQSKYGRCFDEEFKREVAALASQPGAKIEQVAHDLGVSVHSVARWRRRFRTAEGGTTTAAPVAPVPPRPGMPASAAELERENRALRRELQGIRQQRAILKKALAIFSLDPQ